MSFNSLKSETEKGNKGRTEEQEVLSNTTGVVGGSNNTSWKVYGT